MEDRSIDPRGVITGYQQLGFRVGLLGAEGSVRSTTAEEAIAACRVGDNDFVNLVLTASDSEVPMLTPPPESSQSDIVPPVSRSGPMDSAIVDEIKALAEDANRAGGGYHVMRPLPGVVVKGEYDMTPLLPAFHLPDDLTGQTVLDVGTASGFFAMECARRGGHVTAIDVVPWDTYHWAIAELMGWDVTRIQKDIYDLEPTFGQFDLVISGSLLLHLPDPLGAIRRLRSVCRGRTIVSTSCPEQETDLPICEFVGELQEGGAYWAYWNIGAEALRRMLLAADFDHVEHEDHFTLMPVPDHPHTWSIYHTVAHGVVSA
jgi:2-polyprenyl-3-methyl-5-hydroxy-6-metoxy-1,4-benzoquinol methylase